MDYIEMSEIYSKRFYKKWGYVLIDFLDSSNLMPSWSPIRIKMAFTIPDLYYIGSSKTAHYLCAKQGIKPRLINPIKRELTSIELAKQYLEGVQIKVPSMPCQIGFCEKAQKWYGWSHRAIYGFGIGGKIKKGSIGYHPTDKNDLLDDMIRFNIGNNDTILESKLDVEDPYGESPGLGAYFKYWYRNKKGDKIESFSWEPYPEKWGKGEWTAKTLEEAKEMAIDFARAIA